MTAKEAGIPVVTDPAAIPAVGPAILKTKVVRHVRQKNKEANRYSPRYDGKPLWEINNECGISGWKTEAFLAIAFSSTKEPARILDLGPGPVLHGRFAYAETADQAVQLYIDSLPLGELDLLCDDGGVYWCYSAKRPLLRFGSTGIALNGSLTGPELRQLLPLLHVIKDYQLGRGTWKNHLFTQALEKLPDGQQAVDA